MVLGVNTTDKELVMDCGHYWIRHKYEKINRVGYVCSDHDGNLYVWFPNINEPMEITDDWLEVFSYEKVVEPSDTILSKDALLD